MPQRFASSVNSLDVTVDNAESKTWVVMSARGTHDRLEQRVSGRRGRRRDRTLDPP